MKQSCIQVSVTPKLCLAAVLCAASVFAQQEVEKSQDTIKVDVDIVNILFNVRNKSNGLVGSLEKNNFTLYENGQQQTIKYFTRETDLPLTIGLLVDVSLSQEHLIDTERQAAYSFFSEVLKEKDLAFLISFGSEAELLQDYTNSRKLLQKGLDQLRLNAPAEGLHPGPVPTAHQARGTILWDTVYLAANEQLKGQVGRKAVVVITDGNDQGSRVKLEQAVKAAQIADAIVYGIYYVDDRFYRSYNGYGGISLGGGGDRELRRLAEETGGRVLRVDRKHTLHDIFKEIQDDLRTQYSIGYTPTNLAKDGSFRKIEIKTSDKDLKVQARKGYFATARSE
jgi:VWFA-related protein